MSVMAVACRTTFRCVILRMVMADDERCSGSKTAVLDFLVGLVQEKRIDSRAQRMTKERFVEANGASAHGRSLCFHWHPYITTLSSPVAAGAAQKDSGCEIEQQHRQRAQKLPTGSSIISIATTGS